MEVMETFMQTEWNAVFQNVMLHYKADVPCYRGRIAQAVSHLLNDNGIDSLIDMKVLEAGLLSRM